ncbi:Mu-like prophage protein gp29 [Mycobacteroides abscessus subsp. abscessus]|uniref:phage portal protein family protein n=1 Tax=Mycobacteroides abscessus TaxID=36809 RepID=UPI00092CDF48|nr:hypothetical protein [Mycobacteroides abscessus]SIK42877.1 Mu-like prophage protein gp29 [Mycobacteroides abscessus subsp. abscessus]SLC46203.1 Mu-like prophage protein gp29 [Mycobacteroides abscessus subsp. abscessus]
MADQQAPKKTAAPRTEQGYVLSSAGATGWGGPIDQFEQTADLIWPLSVWTYTRMVREDARISSVLRAIGLPIRRTAWRIRQNGASDEVTEFIARNLGLPIEGAADEDEPQARSRGRFSWDKHLQQALMALRYGHSVFEQVYRLEGEGANIRAVLRKLAPRPQVTIAKWNVDRDGGLISIEQHPSSGFTMTSSGVAIPAGGPLDSTIPINRLVVYAYEPDPGVWIGNSLLRPAYKHWKLKDELMRIEAAAARRHGIGVPWIKGNENDSQDEERMDALLDVASKYSGGESSGLALAEGQEAGIMSPSGTPMDPRRAIEYHDHQMALVALAHFLNLDGKGGSYALASVQADTFVQSVQTVAEDIRNTAQAHIVEDLVDLNFGEDEPAPLLVFDEIGSRQDATAAALQMLVNAGLLTPDARLEAFIRSATGLPGPDPNAPEAEPEPDDESAAAPRNSGGPVRVRTHTRARPGGASTATRNGDPTLW